MVAPNAQPQEAWILGGRCLTLNRNHEIQGHAGIWIQDLFMRPLEYVFQIWVFPKIGVPQNGWFIMENPIKMEDLEVPLFLETPIYSNILQVVSYQSPCGLF